MENKTPELRESFDNDSEDMMSPPKQSQAGDQQLMKVHNSLGKRFMKAHNKFSAGGNNRLMDDAMNITPFS